MSRTDIVDVVERRKDGRWLVRGPTGKTFRLKFEQCSICKQHSAYTQFVGSVCYTCKGIKCEPASRYVVEKPDGKRGYRSERYAQLVQATPPWVNRKDIAKVFAEATRVSLETGIEHQVDHIYPITHTEFCGLNVQWNLRVIPKKSNQTKGNKPPLDYLQQISDT